MGSIWSVSGSDHEGVYSVNWGAAATRGGSPWLLEKRVRFLRPRTKQIRGLGGAARKRICFVGFAKSPIHYQKSENLEGGFASFRNGEKRLLEASKSDGFSLLLGRLSAAIWDWAKWEKKHEL